MIFLEILYNEKNYFLWLNFLEKNLLTRFRITSNVSIKSLKSRDIAWWWRTISRATSERRTILLSIGEIWHSMIICTRCRVGHRMWWIILTTMRMMIFHSASHQWIFNFSNYVILPLQKKYIRHNDGNSFVAHFARTLDLRDV